MSERRRNLSLQVQRSLKGRGERAVRIHRRRSCRGSRRRRNRLNRRLPRPRGSRSSSRRDTTCNRRRSRVAPAVSTASIQGAVVDVVRTPRESRRLACDRVDLLQPVRRRRPQHPPRSRFGRTPRTQTPTWRVSLRRRRAADISFLRQLGTPPGPDRIPFEPPSNRLARTEIARHRTRRVFALKGRRPPRVVQSRGCQGCVSRQKGESKHHPAKLTSILRCACRRRTGHDPSAFDGGAQFQDERTRARMPVRADDVHVPKGCIGVVSIHE